MPFFLEKIITYKKRVYAMKIAVVFDSAGTLLRMYRVAKNVNTGAILNEVVSTELVGKNLIVRSL